MTILTKQQLIEKHQNTRRVTLEVDREVFRSVLARLGENRSVIEPHSLIPLGVALVRALWACVEQQPNDSGVTLNMHGVRVLKFEVDSPHELSQVNPSEIGPAESQQMQGFAGLGRCID